MKLKDLIAIADENYPDGRVGMYFQNPSGNHGDGLAEFIVRELKDTFDPHSTDLAQQLAADRVMESAAESLHEVASAFSRSANTITARAIARVQSTKIGG